MSCVVWLGLREQSWWDLPVHRIRGVLRASMGPLALRRAQPLCRFVPTIFSCTCCLDKSQLPGSTPCVFSSIGVEV